MLSAGGGGVRDATVTLTTSTGQLTSTTVRTDSTGHGTTEWSGDRTGRITASLGELTTSASIEVLASGPVPPGPPPGPGPPAPPPPGPPTPPPPPPPGPPAPPPGAPGDLVLTITPSPANPNASQAVTWTATMTSSTGATVPFMDRFGWDVNGDGLVDRVEASPVVTYAQGTYTAFLEVRTSDNRAVQATRTITVDVAPSLSATLQALPASADFATTVNFTANVTPVGNTGALTYLWNFGNGGPTPTTGGNTNSVVYSTLGTKTAQVTVTSANGQTTTATTTVTVSAPALVVGINVTGTRTVGTSLQIIATVTSSGIGANGVPPSMTFDWDYDGNGTAEERTTGGSPRTVNHAFNAAGTYTVKVVVTAVDGRTATNSTSVTITP